MQSAESELIDWFGGKTNSLYGDWQRHACASAALEESNCVLKTEIYTLFGCCCIEQVCYYMVMLNVMMGQREPLAKENCVITNCAIMKEMITVDDVQATRLNRFPEAG